MLATETHRALAVQHLRTNPRGDSAHSGEWCKYLPGQKIPDSGRLCNPEQGSSTPEQRTERNQEGRGGQSAVSRPSEERADRSRAKELTHEPASPPDLACRGARTVPPAGSRSHRPLNRTVCPHGKPRREGGFRAHPWERERHRGAGRWCGTETGPWDWPGPHRSFLKQGVVPHSPHGSWVPPVTPVKLDALGPPAHHSQPSRDSPAASLHHAGQGPKGSAVGRYHDATTITDLCSCGNVPEVEIISLLGEQLPHYTLRADTLFGYEHDDWLHTPLLPPEAPTPLTPQQIEETLKYFLLCSERVGRITKTYHDLDAVTNLLEEKERDLELAARIGQSLLKQNRSLTERNELLEEQLELAKEEVAQLRHEVSMRDDLLHLYTNTVEDSEPATVTATPLRRNESSLSLQQHIQYDLLQQKLRVLEEENQKLRSEATSIATETCQYEDQEQQLMLDCVEQFSEASRHVASLSEELARKTEDTARQQEEISQLLAQIVDLQQKCRTYGVELEELQQHLAATKASQQNLRTEMQDLQEKYAECEGMLHEAQEEIKGLRTRNLPSSSLNRYSLLPLDSLAAEIKGIMRKGADSSSSSEYQSYKRVFETVKVVNQAVKAKSRAESPQNLPSSKPSSALPSAGCSRVSTPRTSYYGSDSASLALENLESGLGEEKLRGTPGTPGRHDLEAALQRLSARQESHASERSFFETEREQKLNQLAGDVESSSGFLTPNDSILSTGTNYSGSSEHTGGSSFSLGSLSYLPDKLQIVKPLEGSVTLHHWQQLAKPNLGGILDPRPGVLTKDFRQLDVDLEEIYNLNDLEEDEVDLSAFPALAASTPSKAKGCSSGERGPMGRGGDPEPAAVFIIQSCPLVGPLRG
ncbi:huntingtin-associated protein 1 isoform X3 [Gopherus evgoodei]|uniref:huntingtin-associated protein 1 isoform X3 n=1 Tax=Gopherus evgoodei TaxID=1825980 RepID=UPI0011D02B3B|nr:huntingtin-associated protein 1 isoform X3 [Gopherus evgoodei]